jgi:hypothetical protein
MNNFPYVLTLRLNLEENINLNKLAESEGLPKSLVLRHTLHKRFREAVKEGLLPKQPSKTDKGTKE